MVSKTYRSYLFAAVFLAGLRGAFCLVTKSARTAPLLSGVAVSGNVTMHEAATQRAKTTIFDFGFYDGADSWQYLSGGYNVVSIEADPSLVKKAHDEGKFAQWFQTGQLQLVNAAIAPAEGTATAWTKFYLNACTKEWNSFYKSVGCRSCTPPHPESADSCTSMDVQSMTCEAVFLKYGVPTFLKLDIEGAESSCWAAMGKLQPAQRPAYVSNEVGDVKLIDSLSKLGYQSFKVVLQRETGKSGPWGDEASDCRSGKAWKSYGDARWELNEIFNKAGDPADPCPGMKQGVGGNNMYVWYDLHASLLPVPAGR